MKNHKKISHKINNSKRIFLIPLFLTLLIGTFVSIIQTRTPQQSQSQATVPNDCTVDPSSLSYSPNEQTLLEQINAFRHDNGIPSLDSDLTLKRAAAWMSKDLKTRNVLVHVDSLGRDTATRLSDCGVPFPSVIGEIIDSGDADVNSLMAAWKHSPSQTNRLLNRNFTHVGIALTYGSTTSDSFWTVTFAGPDIKPTTSPAPSQGITPAPTSGSPTSTPSVNRTPTPTIKLTITPTPKRTPTPTLRLTPTPTEKPPFPFGTLTPTPKPIPGKEPTPVPGKNTCAPTTVIDPKFVRNADDTQLFISVKFPGIGCDGNRNPKHLSRRIQASIIDTKNKEVKIGTADLRFDGNLFRGTMHLGKLPNDIYSLRIIGIRTLQKILEPQFQEISNTRLNVMPEVILRPGDVSEDNAITLLDYNLALACFQDKKCKADATDFIDFNDSGSADVVDYNLLLQSFFQLSGD